MGPAKALGTSLDAAAGREWYPPVKRGLDLVLSSFLLVCLSPVFACCALVISLDSRGPVIFRQPRVGQHGKSFVMLKFRTMFVNNDPSLHRDYVTAFIEGKAASQSDGNGAVYKLVADKRVTRVGRWLRKTSLDELPQLWNVLRGDMSLVGPRPPIQYEVEHYQPAHLGRLAVKPGMTGLWQVSGRSTTSFNEMVALDLAYARDQSLGLDLFILIKTIPVVLFARGAH